MNKNLEEISDGKRYGLNDMVRAACNDCAGCSSCCEDMGESIILDPLDIYELTITACPCRRHPLLPQLRPIRSFR